MQHTDKLGNVFTVYPIIKEGYTDGCAMICKKKPPASDSYWENQEPPHVCALLFVIDPTNEDEIRDVKKDINEMADR